MGADGHWYLVRQEEWPFPDIDPADCHVGKDLVLGIAVLHAYWDTEGRDWMEYGAQADAVHAEWLEGILSQYAKSDDLPYLKKHHPKKEVEKELTKIHADPNFAHSKCCLAAARWFRENAEDHTVWT